MEKTGINALVEGMIKDSNFVIEDSEDDFDNGGFKMESEEEETKATEKVEETETEEQEEETETTEETTEEEESTEEEETESSLTEESTEETTEELSTPVDINETVSQRTEGKFESFDDLLAAFEEVSNKTPEISEPEFANDFIKKLNDLASQGVVIDSDFIQSQSIDYSKYDIENETDGLNLVTMELKLQEPDITDREIEFELSEKYKLDPDEYDERDIERSQLRLLRDAKKAKKNLAENQQKNALPVSQQVDPAIAAEQQKKAEEYAAHFAKSVNDTVSKYEGESFKIGEESFDFKADEKSKKQLHSAMTNTDKFWHRYVNDAGVTNFDLLSTDMFRLQNFDKIVSSAVNQALSAGKNKVASKIKNSTLGSKKNPKAAAKTNTLSDQIFKHFNN